MPYSCQDGEIFSAPGDAFQHGCRLGNTRQRSHQDGGRAGANCQARKSGTPKKATRLGNGTTGVRVRRVLGPPTCLLDIPRLLNRWNYPLADTVVVVSPCRSGASGAPRKGASDATLAVAACRDGLTAAWLLPLPAANAQAQSPAPGLSDQAPNIPDQKLDAAAAAMQRVAVLKRVINSRSPQHPPHQTRNA